MPKRILFILKTQEDFAPFKSWLTGSAYQPELLSPDTVSKQSLATGAGYDLILKEAKNYFLLLLDIDVPWALHLCRQFKSQEKGRDIPLIMTAERVKLMQVTAAIQAGADNFVMKPLEKNYFLGRLGIIEKEIELMQVHKKLIDLSLLRFTFTLMVGEAGGAEALALFKAVFERAILEKTIYVMNIVTTSIIVDRAVEKIKADYPFMASLKYDAANRSLIAEAARVISGQPQEILVAAFRSLTSAFLGILALLTKNILVEEQI